MQTNEEQSSEALIHVSSTLLALSVAPLLLIALLSYHVNLGLETSILWGASRSFLQLSILGAILQPIFYWGEEHACVVLLYVMFMVLFASFEATSRSKYHFQNVFGYMFFAIAMNVTLVSAFAFVIILKPKPVWNPQYVIPIVGMLLGNCVTGISLAMDRITSSLVEQSLEIELYLSFGASPHEACARLVRDAIRVSTTPMLNTMAVIGLVSIPGMMTGQILAGSPVIEAARYQMLIIYLIAVTTFGTILCEMWLVQRIAFDGKAQVLQSGFFYRKESTFQELKSFVRDLFKRSKAEQSSAALKKLIHQNDSQPDYCAVSESLENSANSSTINFIQVVNRGDNGRKTSNLFEFRGLKQSIHRPGKDPIILFDNLSHTIEYGDIVFVTAPSGAGKSTLLRMLSKLLPPDHNVKDDDDMQIMLNGHSNHLPTMWRKQIRYMRQNKIEIPGTPRDFIDHIPTFHSWRNSRQAISSTLQDMMSSVLRFTSEFGLDGDCLDKQWKDLSGGESQRVYLAIALASQPDILLMDESTSALDLDSKLLVERVLVNIVSEKRMGIVWISHDSEQIDRLTCPTNAPPRG